MFQVSLLTHNDSNYGYVCLYKAVNRKPAANLYKKKSQPVPIDLPCIFSTAESLFVRG